MNSNINIILAAPPGLSSEARSTGRSVAHMAYRIGRDFHLYRAEASGQLRGGIMVVDDIGFSGYSSGSVPALAEEIVNECADRRFSGVVLDFSDYPAPALVSLARHISSGSQSHGLDIYVPPSLAGSAEKAHVLVNTAISGGTLESHLEDACNKYGKSRVVLEIEVSRMDFAIPCQTGEGTELNEGELNALRVKYPQSFFSSELCAYYFTYRSKNSTHFVLYDNGASIRHKLRAAEKMGIYTAFLYYPEARDFLKNL